METISRKFDAADISAAFDGEISAMIQGGLHLVAAGALFAVDAVYWSKSHKAADVAKLVGNKVAVLAYKKSRKADYERAIMQTARNWVKKYGAPHAATARNAFYQTILDAETATDAVAFIVASLKTDYDISNISELFDALNGNKVSSDKKADTLENILAKAIDRWAKQDVQEAGDVSGIVSTLVDMLSAESVMSLSAALAERVTVTAEKAIAKAA